MHLNGTTTSKSVRWDVSYTLTPKIAAFFASCQILWLESIGKKLCTNLCITWYVLALGLVCQSLNCHLLNAGTRLWKVEGLGENRWKMNEQRMSARGGNRWYLQPHHLFSSVYPLSPLTSFFQELPGLLCPSVPISTIRSSLCEHKISSGLRCVCDLSHQSQKGAWWTQEHAQCKRQVHSSPSQH